MLLLYFIKKISNSDDSDTNNDSKETFQEIDNLKIDDNEKYSIFYDQSIF